MLWSLAAQALEPLVMYRGDAELQSCDGLVTSWGNLTRIHGAPRVWKVKTPGGVKEVVRFDGASAIWQAVNAWGRVEGARTILAFARIGGEGVLCDGSTRSGADAIRVKGDGSKWEVLKFSRSSGALGGFIVGADVATQNGVKADVAEIGVFRGTLSEKELADEEARLRQKWGEPVDLPEAEQIQPWKPFAGLQTKLLRKNGQDGVNTYRIPGLATSKKGTLLAVFDLRHDNAGDLPGNIDVGLTRSTDDGETWSEGRVIDPRGSMYSCMSVMRDGRIAMVYEGAGGLWFATLSMEDQ